MPLINAFQDGSRNFFYSILNRTVTNIKASDLAGLTKLVMLPLPLIIH
jgi:hypothetical protein